MKKLIVFIFSIVLLGSCQNKKNGVYKTYYDNGSLKEYAEYKNGELHGTSKEYYINEDFETDSLLGQLKNIYEYEYGFYMKQKNYFYNGKINIFSVNEKISILRGEAFVLRPEEFSYDGCPTYIGYANDGSIISLIFYTVVRGVKCKVYKSKLPGGLEFSYQFQSINPNKDDIINEFIVDSTVYKPVNQFYDCGLNINYTDSLLVDHQSEAKKAEEEKKQREAEEERQYYNSDEYFRALYKEGYDWGTKSKGLPASQTADAWSVWLASGHDVGEKYFIYFEKGYNDGVYGRKYKRF